MTANQELQVQDKQELEKPEESTVPARYFVPTTDIFEDDDRLMLTIEMPGVSKDGININVEENRLSIEGKIDFANYEGLEPVYTEYGVGHYQRSFTLSDQIDQSKIGANLSDGVLELMLPKVEAAKPRRIEVR
ncbi:MAG: Hsp20/alpha crystallin family protein [Hyphomicrobiaceae bacterium]